MFSTEPGLGSVIHTLDKIAAGDVTSWTDAELHEAIGHCRQGEPVRKLIDRLIAAVAIREATPVLPADVDFDVLARHSPLQIEPAG